MVTGQKFSGLLHKREWDKESGDSNIKEVKNKGEKKSGKKKIERTNKIAFSELARRSIRIYGHGKNLNGQLGRTERGVRSGSGEIIRKILIEAITFYQKAISPSLPHTCRYYPTCSEYTKQAILKYGVFKGLFKGFLRILRCNPLFPGGYDPV